MLKFALLESDGTEAIVLIAGVVLLIQLLMCFLLRRVWIKLIPTVLSFVVTVAFAILMVTSEGWDVLGYLLLGLCSFCALCACAVAWLVWAIVRAIKKRKNKSAQQDVEQEA